MIKQITIGGRPLLPITSSTITGRNILGMNVPGINSPAVLKPSAIAGSGLARPVLKPSVAIASKEMPGIPSAFKSQIDQSTVQTNLRSYLGAIIVAGATAYVLRNKKPIVRFGAAAVAGLLAYKFIPKSNTGLSDFVAPPIQSTDPNDFVMNPGTGGGYPGSYSQFGAIQQLAIPVTLGIVGGVIGSKLLAKR